MGVRPRWADFLRRIYLYCAHTTDKAPHTRRYEGGSLLRTPTSEMRLLDESTARTDAATPPRSSSPPPRSLGRAGRVRFPRLARQVRIRSLGRVGSSEGHVTPFPQGSCHLTSPRDLDHCRIGAFSCCFPPFLPAPHAPLPQPGPRPSLLPWVLDFARLRSAAGAFIFFFSSAACGRSFFFLSCSLSLCWACAHTSKRGSPSLFTTAACSSRPSRGRDQWRAATGLPSFVLAARK